MALFNVSTFPRLFCDVRLPKVLFSGAQFSGMTSRTSTRFSLRTRLGLCHNFSTSKARDGLGRRLQWANEKYEHLLQQRFPRFYILYSTFLNGFRLLFQDAKEVREIKTRMLSNNTDRWKLPYRELEKLRQFRRDMIKAIPLLLISIPPFANYVVFILMYLFPRHVLIPHFWTSQQLVEFQAVYHSHRVQSYRPVIDGLMRAVPSIKDVNLQMSLLELCGKVQRGGHPTVSEVHALRTLFAGSMLGLKSLYTDHKKQLCSLLFLTSNLPSFLIGQRLNNHAIELMRLDRALSQLGLHQLSDAEIKQACYMRGINGYSLSSTQCREWLAQWLQFSVHLRDSEASLYLHSMVLLTVNYPQPHHCWHSSLHSQRLEEYEDKIL
ncbi:LETM1 domain-containing protein 1 isoform X1 [Alosa pseudoharengus]|uniref:LETM1 domain-containing protein 1 isoform X1 n=1 Tax=Alosa pseudoharengus TaxID=34774 RepID=UPI003F8AA8DA